VELAVLGKCVPERTDGLVVGLVFDNDEKIQVTLAWNEIAEHGRTMDVHADQREAGDSGELPGEGGARWCDVVIDHRWDSCPCTPISGPDYRSDTSCHPLPSARLRAVFQTTMASS
jgi:hypothetical protein